jgi:hypothetical protein
MRRYGSPKRQADLVEQARENLGLGVDALTVTDALFEAAFRALDKVPVEHPGRWAVVVGYWEKMTALYEQIEGGNAAGDGLVIGKRPAGPDNGRDHDPQPRNTPNLATPEKPKGP